MSNNGNRVYTPRARTILNDWRYHHPRSLKPVEGGKFPAQLMFEQKNNGEIVLKVNDGVYTEGKSNAHKEITLSFYDRNLFFEALLEAANTKEFTSKVIQIKDRVFIHSGGGSKLSDSPMVRVTLHILKDEQSGVISVGYSKGDYRVQFPMIGPNETIILSKTAEGTQEDKALTSRCYIRAWVSFHQPLLDRLETEGWTPPKPRNGGNSSGGGNNNQGGGSNQNFNDFDDDIDF